MLSSLSRDDLLLATADGSDCIDGDRKLYEGIKSMIGTEHEN